jgi:hypothetical protein
MRKCSEDLCDVRRLIDEVGWVQGLFYTQDDKGYTTGYCLAGAINAVGRRALHSCIRDIIGAETTEWNDNPIRTKIEVLDVIDKAIEVARKREDREGNG